MLVCDRRYGQCLDFGRRQRMVIAVAPTAFVCVSPDPPRSIRQDRAVFLACSDQFLQACCNIAANGAPSALTSPSIGSRCTASMRTVPLRCAGSCGAAKF